MSVSQSQRGEAQRRRRSAPVSPDKETSILIAPAAEESRPAELSGRSGLFLIELQARGGQPVFERARAVGVLEWALRRTKLEQPFLMEALVVLPDRARMLWSLPEGGPSCAARVARIKRRTARQHLRRIEGDLAPTPSRVRAQEKRLWAPGFLEARIENWSEYEEACRSIHYNPVAAGHARCPHTWPYSSFHSFIERGRGSRDWRCTCARGRTDKGG